MWKKWLLSLGTICYTVLANNVVMTSVMGGTYNSFLKQVGYCKLQSFDTISRNTSGSPPLFTSGQVFMGVGLSDVQFGNSIVSCGKCIEILTVGTFYQFNHELTEWNYSQPVPGSFYVMVMDQCKDPICQTGFLDFDIYNVNQPVAYGNPTNLTWKYVPCPVCKHDTIELLFCLGWSSCNSENSETRTVEDMFYEAANGNSFAIYPRNFRNSIVNMKVQGENLEDISSWLWISPSAEKLQNTTWDIQWTSEKRKVQHWKLDWTKYFHLPTTKGYRGGIVIKTPLQN